MHVYIVGSIVIKLMLLGAHVNHMWGSWLENTHACTSCAKSMFVGVCYIYLSLYISLSIYIYILYQYFEISKIAMNNQYLTLYAQFKYQHFTKIVFFHRLCKLTINTTYPNRSSCFRFLYPHLNETLSINFANTYYENEAIDLFFACTH